MHEDEEVIRNKRKNMTGLLLMLLVALIFLTAFIGRMMQS